MATRIAPDAILAQTNLSGAVSAIQDDPDSPTSSWLTAPGTNNATEVRVSFPSPLGDLDPGAGLQEIRVLVRKTTGNTAPTAVVELWESGSLKATLVSSTAVSSTAGQILSATFAASLLSDISGAGVEVRVAGTPGGGNPGNRASLEVGAIEWNATTAAPAKVGPGSMSAASSTVAGTGRKDITGGTASLAIGGSSVGEKLNPDTKLEGTASFILTNVDEGCDAPDGDGGAVSSGDSARLGFPTPATVPGGAQQFRIVGKDQLFDLGGVSSVDVVLWENGLPLTVLGTLTFADTSLQTVAWDASALSDPTGSQVEVRLTCKSGDFSLDAVDWVVGLPSSGIEMTASGTPGSAPVGVRWVSDPFDRVSSGWGTNPDGLTWDDSDDPADFSVDGSRGVITLPNTSSPHNNTIAEGVVNAIDSVGRAVWEVDRLPSSGFVTMVRLYSRRGVDLGDTSDTDADDIRHAIRLRDDGRLELQHDYSLNGTRTTVNSSWFATGKTYTAGDDWNVRYEVEGAAPAITVRTKLWKVGDAEPATFDLEETFDPGAIGLNHGGTTGIHIQTSVGNTNVPFHVYLDDLTFDDLSYVAAEEKSGTGSIAFGHGMLGVGAKGAAGAGATGNGGAISGIGQKLASGLASGSIAHGVAASGVKAGRSSASTAANAGISGTGRKLSSGTVSAGLASGIVVSGRKQAAGTGSTDLSTGVSATGNAFVAKEGTAALALTSGTSVAGSRQARGVGVASATSDITVTGSKAIAGSKALALVSGTTQTGKKATAGVSFIGAATGIAGSGEKDASSVEAIAHASSAVSTGIKAAAGVGSEALASGVAGSGSMGAAGAAIVVAISATTQAGTKAVTGAGSISAASSTIANGAGLEDRVGQAALALSSAGTAAGSRGAAGVASETVSGGQTLSGHKNAVAAVSEARSLETLANGSKSVAGAATLAVTAGATASGTAAEQGAGTASMVVAHSTVASGSRQAAGAGQTGMASGEAASGLHAGLGTASVEATSTTSASGTTTIVISKSGTGSTSAVSAVSGGGAKSATDRISDARTAAVQGTGAKGGVGDGLVPLHVDLATGGIKAGHGSSSLEELVPLVASGSKATAGSTTMSMLATLLAAGFQPREVEAVATFIASLGASASHTASMDAIRTIALSLDAERTQGGSLSGEAGSESSLLAVPAHGVS